MRELTTEEIIVIAEKSMERNPDQWIEAYMDKHTLSDVLEIISYICHEKAAHIQATYNDKPLAKQWAKNGNRCHALAERVKQP